MSALDEGVFDLAGIVRDVALRHPTRVAVIEPKQRGGRLSYERMSYQRLSREAESVAAGLREIGIREGTRVVYMAPPSFEAAVISVALSRVGATSLMIDPSVGYLNVAERLRRVSPEAMVGIPIAHAGRVAFGWGPRLMKHAIVVNGRFPGAHTLASLRRAAPLEPERARVTPRDAAAVLYTTGSTGPAKPAEYLHSTFAAVHRVAHHSWAFSPDKIPVDLVAFPAFMTVALSFGGTCVVPPMDFVRQKPATAPAPEILTVINDCEVQSLFASPALLERLATHARDAGLKMPSLRRVIGGGAPLFPELMRQLTAVMGEGAEVCSNYGATEALPSTEISSREVLADKALRARGQGICVGRALPGVTVRVVPLTDGVLATTRADAELPVGEVGELLVSGENVSPRYFDDAASTAKNKAYDEGGQVWHRLGDVGYRDGAGRLWVLGRAGHVVRTERGLLFPMRAETLLDGHPDVRRSGLVGVASGAHQQPVACVELRGKVARAERPRILRELLALLKTAEHSQHITRVLFSDGLPVDPRHNAKIERPKLAQWAAKQLR